MYKLLQKNKETFNKYSRVSEVLTNVTFTLGEKVVPDSKPFVVTVKTNSDIDWRVRQYSGYRVVEEKALNEDFTSLINIYNTSLKLIEVYHSDSTYDPNSKEQFAIIGYFETKEKAIAYIEGVWNFILSQF